MFLKPTHLFQGLVATPADVAKNWQHRARKYALILGLSKPDKYLSSMNIGANQAVWAVAASGHKITCKYCKHAIARVTIDNGWTVETCSAQQFNDLFNSKHTEQWVQNLNSVYETDIKTNSGDLQRTQ